MRRELVQPREGWQQRVENIGFSFHSIGGCYWNESACYVFDEEEIDAIELATEELHAMCMEAVDHVVRNDRFAELRIPGWCHDRIRSSWNGNEPSLYGRFDFSFSQEHGLKLLEYNADTPTSVYEAAVVQWHWLQETFPEKDQFNSIHEKLIERWRSLRQDGAGSLLHLSSAKGQEEDFLTVEYLRDVAIQAGFETVHLAVEEVGWDRTKQCFVDLDERQIDSWFKLYPWEWIVEDRFGKQLADASVRTVEPWWKMVLSNKGILAILWEMFPESPYLLPASLTPALFKGGYVRKPLLGREGANINIISSQGSVRSPGEYEDGGWLFQAPAMLPCFEGNYAVVGSWVVGAKAAGIGIREDDTVITRDTSRFVPHYF